MASAKSVASRHARAGGRGPARREPAERGRSPSPGPERRDGSRPRTALAKPADALEVFRRFDINGDGKIDRNELAAVLTQLDPVRWTSRNATLLLMEVDKNFDGSVDYAEFVDWVSAEGHSQTDFRDQMGMPRSRAELAALEKERQAQAMKGTAAELDTHKAVFAHRADCVRNQVLRKDAAHDKYERLKAEAERASQIFMPMYDRFKQAIAGIISVPAKEVLDHDVKEVSEIIEIEDPNTHAKQRVCHPPIGIQLTVQAMCKLFKILPGTRCDNQPDYWVAFLNAKLKPKLIEDMEHFDKEHIPGGALKLIREFSQDDRFEPDRVREETSRMGRSSNLIVAMCLWVHFLVKYQQAGVKSLWERVTQAENDMHREERALADKEEELRSVKRLIQQAEAAMVYLR